MEQVALSDAGQIEITKGVRDALQLFGGTHLLLELRGEQIVLSKEPNTSTEAADFVAHLLGGPKVDDFLVERDRDLAGPAPF